ncbi:MAG: DegT/DnrJ/EryC1/StrS family aminotransferase [Lachnospiraceae bacterium]|jgi:perosamine synthetase|nr:DegT/DnrJ/EryC1/StrS family aminotransferase [Lachnospiraceae bacterium]
MDRISNVEWNYVKEVLNGQFSSISTYQMVTKLETKFAEKFHSKHAVAMVNGTATLHAALEAAEVGPGDEVICPPLTMSSTSIAVLQANAVPVFADVDRESFLITAESIKKVITQKTRAIITVSLYGLAPQMREIMEVARNNNLIVIEDNAECFGSYQNGQLVGTFGHMASYSFQSSKHLTAGEGGIVITNSDELADKLRRYSGLGYAGISGKKGRITKDDIQCPNYERHVILGWNYRMSDLCAAVALGQLERMEELIKVRRRAASYYQEEVEKCNWLYPQYVQKDNLHSYWTYAVMLDTEKVKWHEFRNKYLEFGGDGIYAAWKLSYQEPMFKNKSFLNREKLGLYDHYDYNAVHCINAEYLQPKLLQFKTNYYCEEKAKQQAKILNKTIAYFNKNRG